MMKRFLTGLFCLAGLLAMTSCEREASPTAEVYEHTIFYRIGGEGGAGELGGRTVHVGTEDEYNALLDSFCEYAQEGSAVMFCGTERRGKGISKAVGTTGTPTTITTSDREELKTWMKAMESAGKTVSVTYNDGVWNGRAYANLGSGEGQEPRIYSGTLAFVPSPVLEEPPLTGVVWALRLNADSTLVVTLHGMMMWSDSIDDYMRLIEGSYLELEGVVGRHSDLNGNAFMTLMVVDRGDR